MRKSLLAIALFFSTFTTAFAITTLNTALTDTSDYKYYFFVGKELFDIRDFSKVPLSFVPGDLKKVAGLDTIIINDSKSLWLYGKKGKFIRRLDFKQNGLISPDMNYVLYHKDRDLWAADISWKAGGLVNHRQLTQLGVFSYKIPIDHWYGDYICLNYRQNYYIVDAKKGTIENNPFLGAPGYETEFHFQYKKPVEKQGIISPTGRFVTARSPRNYFAPYTVDLKTYQKHPLDGDKIYSTRGYPMIWLDAHTAFITEKAKQNDDYLYGGWIYNFATSTTVTPIPHSVLDMEFTDNMRRFANGKARCISPGHDFMLFIQEKNYVQQRKHGHYLSIINLETKEQTQLFHSADIPFYEEHIRNDVAFGWLSDRKLLYTTHGDLLNQGTWVYDVITKESKKITSYKAGNIYRFENAGYTIFQNKDKIFRINADGTGLKEFSVNGYNQKIKLFLE